MPRISAFYGILIYMYFSEHGVPHFHAVYGDYQASIGLRGDACLKVPFRRGHLLSSDYGLNSIVISLRSTGHWLGQAVHSG